MLVCSLEQENQRELYGYGYKLKVLQVHCACFVLIAWKVYSRSVMIPLPDNNVYEGVSGTSQLMVNPLRSLWLREGEVGLSPLTIFVPGGMDPLLRQLDESCLGLSYPSTISTCGGFLHLTTSTPWLQAQNISRLR